MNIDNSCIFRLVLPFPWIIDSECVYMFRLVLAIVLLMNRDSGYMFRLVLTFL